jgi:hypothetical protein
MSIAEVLGAPNLVDLANLKTQLDGSYGAE